MMSTVTFNKGRCTVVLRARRSPDGLFDSPDALRNRGMGPEEVRSSTFRCALPAGIPEKNVPYPEVPIVDLAQRRDKPGRIFRELDRQSIGFELPGARESQFENQAEGRGRHEQEEKP